MREELDLIPSELRAIELHKYYLSKKEGREVSLEEAMVDFIDNYKTDFLSKKQLDDCMEQNEEIQRYKWIESEKEGHDIGTEQAALEWITKYGCIWREERESLEENGFLEGDVKIENREGATIEMAMLNDLAHRFDSDLYIHMERMKYYNFKLFGKKEYLNVKSILVPRFLEAIHGERIEFIATGGSARETLAAARRFVLESPPQSSHP
jgi:hypothetical protein